MHEGRGGGGTLPKAAAMDSLEGSPAYTPEQKGSTKRSKTSLPRLRRTNCSTVSSCSESQDTPHDASYLVLIHDTNGACANVPTAAAAALQICLLVS